MMAKPKFKRTDQHKYSKLGVRRKKLQKYRKSKGRDNKIRLNMKGHVKNVKIGFRTAVKGRGLVKGMRVVKVFNVKDLKKVGENMVGMVGKIGNKKKMEIAEEILKSKIKLLNLDAGKFIERMKKKMEKIKEEKDRRDKKKRARDKKTKEKEKEVKTSLESKDSEASKNAEQSSVNKGDKNEKLEEKVEGKEEFTTSKSSNADINNTKQDKESKAGSEKSSTSDDKNKDKNKEEGK